MPPLRRFFYFGLAGFLICAAEAAAAPPTITSITPRGAERGKPVEIVIAGTNLTPKSSLLLPFKAEQAVIPEAKPNPAQVKIKLTVDASVPLGAYPAHLITEDGVAPLFFFCVDAFPGVNEVEDNSTFEKAQKVTVPVVITGQCAGGDVDYFQFEAKKGQRLVIETESARLGSGLLPQLRLTDAEHRFLAADDTQLLGGDARLLFTPPADGTYVIELSDSRYRGGVPPHYRLKIAEYDFVEEVFPPGGKRGDSVEFILRGGTLPAPLSIRKTLVDSPTSRGVMPLALDGLLRPGMLPPTVAVGDLPERVWIKSGGKDPKALDVLPPLTISSRLERKGDADRFQFPVQPGQRYRIAVQAEALGSRLDGVLRITDQAGKLVALVDDVVLPAAPGQAPGTSADPAADVLVPADAKLLTVELRDQRGRGGMNFVYRLSIEPTIADFAVAQPTSELNLPRGGFAALTVPVSRRGYDGPIQLAIPNLPAGLVVQGGHVPPGSSTGLLTVSATAAAPAGPFYLSLEGNATSDGKPIRRAAIEHMVLSKDGAGGTYPLSLFAAAITGAEPLTLQGPPSVDVVQGYAVDVPVQIARAMNPPNLAVEVTGLVPAAQPQPGQAQPAPIVAKPVAVAANAPDAKLNLTVPVRAPEGVMDLLLQGKAKVNNVDRIIVGGAVPLNVKRPFVIEAPAGPVNLAPGQMTTIKATVQRQPVFKEAVQVKVEGLPAGVTLAAPIAAVAPTAPDFQIALKADPKAAETPTPALVKITCTATIAGQPYVHPVLTTALVIKK
jgi:hypothetical protein